jgi:hypothetical protein
MEDSEKYTAEEIAHLKAIEEELSEWEKYITATPSTSEVVETKAQGLTDDEMKYLLFRPCRNKKQLKNWIKTFLQVDLPDSTIDPTSNSNPLDMVWKVYETAVFYDDLKPEERHLKSLFYCSRGSFKTLAACIAELMIMIHTGRNTVHIGLIESQAKNAYNMYFRPFLDKPFIRDWAKLSSILEKSEVNHIPFKKDWTLNENATKATTLQVIPLTMNKTSSPRANLVVKDEIDKVKGEQVQAYENVHGMLTLTNDKRMAMEFDISSRDSAYGMVQELIDNAETTGTKVYHWNRIDITERCPDSRSGTSPIRAYIKKDTLIAISEDEYDELSSEEKKYYEQHWALDGCLTNCKIFAACQGYLRNQRSKCKWLKPIDETQNALLSAPSEEMALSQLLCRTPPTKGLVYSDFSPRKNMITPAKMYEIWSGLECENPKLTTDELIEIFQEADIPLYIGADAGFHSPAALLVAIDHKDNVYVLKEHMPEEVDSEELAHWLEENWKKYSVTRVFVDPESPDLTRSVRKKGFNISDRVDKKRQPGIATVKGFIRRPATQITQLFVNKDCLGIKYEFSRYAYKTDASGKPTDEAAKKYDHALDALRYILHTLYGKARGNTAYAQEVKKQQKLTQAKEATKVAITDKLQPSAVASLVGHRVEDNRHILNEDKEEPKKKKSTTSYDPLDY